MGPCPFIQYLFNVINVLQFLVYRSYTSFVKFIHKYIIFLMLLRVVFKFQFQSSIDIIQKYKNLFVSFISCSLAKLTYHFQQQFEIDSLGYSTWSVMSSANKKTFLSSFSIYMPFIYSYCSGQDFQYYVKILALVLILEEKHLPFTIKYDVSCWFSQLLYTRLSSFQFLVC